jgi:hypothetical protein
MVTYHDLERLLRSLTAPPAPGDYAAEVIPYLVDVWLDDYARTTPVSDIVETTTEGFSYLFDIRPGRLIAAWGVSGGRHGAARDKGRMAGHPLGAGPRYHRGHAIPHRLGGGTDINLVPQLGSVNVGAFRALERDAVKTPGSLYFTYWIYDNRQSQRPTGVDQGLLYPGRAPKIEHHAN